MALSTVHLGEEQKGPEDRELERAKSPLRVERETEHPRPVPRRIKEQGMLQEEGHWEAPLRDKRLEHCRGSARYD